MNNYIAVPYNVLLEEDRCQRTQYSDVEFENLKRRLDDLQQRAKRVCIRIFLERSVNLKRLDNSLYLIARCKYSRLLF